MTTNHDEQPRLLEAFRYFNGEMSETERDAFEKLLADDDSAQSALADVVMIQSALLTESLTASQIAVSVAAPRTAPQSRFAAFLGGTVALIVLLTSLVVLSPDNSTDMSLVSSDVSQLEQNDLDAVGVWTQLESDSNVAASRRRSNSDTDDGHADHNSDNQLNIPDWMVVAVQASTIDLEEVEFDADFQGETL